MLGRNFVGKNSISTCITTARLFAAQSRAASSNSITTPLPNVPSQISEPPKFPAGISGPTKLENGLTVVTYPVPSTSVAIGLFFKAGARYEDASNQGVSHVLRRLASKGSKNRTQVTLTRQLESLSEKFASVSGRELVGYTGEVLPNQVRPFIQLLGDFTRPELMEFQVKEAVQEALEDSEAAAHNSQEQLFEALHDQAYHGVGLGQSLYLPSWNSEKITAEAIQNYMSKYYTGDRGLVVAIGDVDHRAVVDAVSDTLALPATGAGAAAGSKYVGGEARLRGSDESHVILAFEGASLHSKERTKLLSLYVLRHILGGGSWISGRSVGDGKSSRLNVNLVSKYKEVSGATSFVVPHSDSGLFGVYASGASGSAGVLAEGLAAELASLNKSVSAEEVARAKNLAKAEVLFSTETRSELACWVSRYSLFSDKFSTPLELAADISRISVADVQKAVADLLKSNVTIIGAGDLSALPIPPSIQKVLAK